MKRYIVLLLVLGASALAQNIRYDGIAQGPKGSVPNATVAFCSQPANISTTPCSPLLALCSSLTDAVCAQPNPVTADSLGNFHAYVKATSVPFTVQIYGPQVAAPYVLVDQGTVGSGGGGGGGATLTPIVQTSTQTGATSDVRITNAIGACSGSNCIVWANDSTNQIWAACPTWGSTNVTLVLFAVTYTYSGTAATCTVPANVTLQWYSGALLSPTTGKTVNIQGGISAGVQTIFSNAAAGQGTIDLTGNYQVQDVYPEWWGASPAAAASTNSPALQAAVTAAYGIPSRTNGSPNLVYNRRFHLSGIYSVNATMNTNSMNGFLWTCEERFACGFKQTATNAVILNVTCGGAYGVFDGITWETSVSQDLAHPLINLDHTCGGADLALQNLDFKENVFSGGSAAKIGVQIAASGGGAQGSTIYFHNIEALGFTEAAVMVGAGSNCTATALATNSGAIAFYGGDFQSNPAYAVELFGPGIPVDFYGTTFEDSTSFFGQQTGYDVCGQIGAAGATFVWHGVRSESPFTTGGGPWSWYDSYNVDAAPVPVPGNTPVVNQIIQGYMGSHGAWYQVTAVAGAYSGLGSPGSPLTASSGTGTTIVDSVGGFTVNAWVGWQVTLLAGTAANEWCIVTSNTANTFTCTAGWKTDFPNDVPIVNPDNTTTYFIEPNYLTMTTDGGVTFAAITKRIVVCNSYGASFVAGLQLSDCSPSQTKYYGLHVTRGDWGQFLGAFHYDGVTVSQGMDGVLAGFSSNGPGGGGGDINVHRLRNVTFNRNGLTEVGYPIRNESGTKVYHFFSGQQGGGISIADTYFGVTNSGANFSGSHFLCNNSNNLNLCTFWDPDGKLRQTPVTFSTLQACSGANEGSTASVKDSTVNTYGSTITGGGTNHVHAYCNGTNWVVD